MAMNILSEKKWIDEIWQKTENKLSRVALRSYNKLPYTAVNGVHDEVGKGAIDWWTNGFWGGMMWLMYAETKKDVYKNTAINSEKILKVTDENFCDYDENTDALVLYGTERFPHESADGLHIPIIYGDFFFVEALLKLKGNNFFIW